MPTLILESENTSALNAIKAVAKELHVKITQRKTEDSKLPLYERSYVRKATRKLDIKKLAGSIPNLDMDPKTFRKKAWERPAK